MRRLAAVLLMFALSGCGADDVPAPEAITTPPPSAHVPRKGAALSCGQTKVGLPAMPEGLTRAGSFGRLGSLTRPLEVKGVIWRREDEQLYVGVVCGARTAEEFVTLVASSSLTAYKGMPALRWNTRTGVRNFMWLERPGTAVYIAATPGLAAQIRNVAAGVALDQAP
ncbi:hypothetical protein [Nonomuraea sp. JJY05]|jgi:hypothetical protein|uniref:hypothetical protein n=1 Tax=Nonomuraea sp. JJY05 TaxID=3350255 RepID=UPI00373FC503